MCIPPALLNYVIDWHLRQALRDYPGVRVGTKVHVSNFSYADDIVLPCSNYKEMQNLRIGVNHRASTVGMHINASKANVMSTVIVDEQRQDVLLDGKGVDRNK